MEKIKINLAKNNFSDILVDNQLCIRLMKREELLHYSYLVHKYVSPYYPETENEYAYNLAENYFGNKKIQNKNSHNRKIWTIILKNTIIGYFTLTEKKEGLVKLSPCVLDPNYVGKGIGYEIIEILEDLYRNSGYRKFYTTIPEINKIAINLVIKSGFSVEGVLKKHYSTQYNEIILGKILNSKIIINPEVEDINNSTIITRKRGGSVKIDFGNDKFDFMKDSLIYKNRRLYTFIKEDDTSFLDLLKEKGFITEGSIIAPTLSEKNFKILSFNKNV